MFVTVGAIEAVDLVLQDIQFHVQARGAGTPEALAALYAAKRSGRNGVCCYSAGLVTTS